jgi:hypothetical protein
MNVFNQALTFFEDALEKNSSGKLGLETNVVFDDSAWTLLKKVSPAPGFAVFDEKLN